MTTRFTVDLGWGALLAGLDIEAGEVLRRARLPADLFARPRPLLEPEEFLRLWEALAGALDLPDPGLRIGTAVTAEAFSPPLFAAFCSPTLTVALERLSLFKPLVGPLRLDVASPDHDLEVRFAAAPGVHLPAEFVAAELVFLVHMARLATREEIRPLAVEMAVPPGAESYERFFGCAVAKGDANLLVFAAEDAAHPFVGANPALFAAFEPELRTRLEHLRTGASVTDRVRAALMEGLPSGRVEAGELARALGMSARSLQRRLSEEGTTFKGELQRLRTRLATNYLRNTAHSSAEIAFLLGYEDPNSFIRAFRDWTGTTPEAARR